MKKCSKCKALKEQDWQGDVLLFHKRFGAYIGSINSEIPLRVNELRSSLIGEEHKELQEALDSGDKAQIAKESADLIYVILGSLVSYGINLNPVWDAVQYSNMQKVGGKSRPDGKVLKPEGWKAPDINAIIKEQQRNQELLEQIFGGTED